MEAKNTLLASESVSHKRPAASDPKAGVNPSWCQLASKETVTCDDLQSAESGSHHESSLHRRATQNRLVPASAARIFVTLEKDIP